MSAGKPFSGEEGVPNNIDRSVDTKMRLRYLNSFATVQDQRFIADMTFRPNAAPPDVSPQ